MNDRITIGAAAPAHRGLRQPPRGGAGAAHLRSARPDAGAELVPAAGLLSAAPTPSKATRSHESDQERSCREWQENYARVSGANDLAALPAAEINAAIHFASHQIARLGPGRAWQGDENAKKQIQAYQREIESLQFHLKLRQHKAAPAVPAAGEQRPTAQPEPKAVACPGTPQIYFVGVYLRDEVHAQALGFTRHLHEFVFATDAAAAERVARHYFVGTGNEVSRLAGAPRLAVNQRLSSYTFPEQILDLPHRLLADLPEALREKSLQTLRRRTALIESGRAMLAGQQV